MNCGLLECLELSSEELEDELEDEKLKVPAYKFPSLKAHSRTNSLEVLKTIEQPNEIRFDVNDKDKQRYSMVVEQESASKPGASSFLHDLYGRKKLQHKRTTSLSQLLKINRTSHKYSKSNQ